MTIATDTPNTIVSFLIKNCRGSGYDGLTRLVRYQLPIWTSSAPCDVAEGDLDKANHCGERRWMPWIKHRDEADHFSPVINYPPDTFVWVSFIAFNSSAIALCSTPYWSDVFVFNLEGLNSKLSTCFDSWRSLLKTARLIRGSKGWIDDINLGRFLVHTLWFLRSSKRLDELWSMFILCIRCPKPYNFQRDVFSAH